MDFRTYLEKEQYAGKTINSLDGAIRGFFTAVLGKGAMINVKNYRNASVRQRKDLVPTLEELRKILDVCSIEEKFRVIFIAQTGMRISDALTLKVGDIRREIDLGNIPLAISYLPEKDRESIGERITFMASDGIEILKAYLRWRKDLGEEILVESPLFASRTNRGIVAIGPDNVNEMIHKIAKKADLNGDWKYGILRAHSFRKFFITQMTNHGVQDKVVDFFVGHAVTEIDRVYWARRVDELRKIYADRQQHLNPISLKQEYDLSKIEGLQAKIAELESLMELIKQVPNPQKEYEVRIVSTEEEIIELASQGWECQTIGLEKWLMRRKV
ncbi:MAG: tyrosine-type recombinase/integrase [Thermoplasmataceae archaeon]